MNEKEASGFNNPDASFLMNTFDSCVEQVIDSFVFWIPRNRDHFESIHIAN